MKCVRAPATLLAFALAVFVSCGRDASDPDPGRSLASGAERANAPATPSGAANAPPRIERVTFNPPQPLSEGTLEAIVSASDPEGNLVHLSYAWRVNGRAVDSGEGQSTIHLPVLAHGDRVEVTVVASDGASQSDPFQASARTDNLPPQITFLYVTPQNKKIRRGDVLTAVPEAVDPENDSLTYTYRWRVNGVDAGEERQFDTRALRRGDKIALSVVASDGTSESNPRELEPIELVNSPPMIKQLPVLEHQGALLSYQFEAEDPEGDRNLRFFLNDAPEGMEIDALTGLLTWQPRADQAGKHVVKVGVKDSEGDASQFDWEVAVNAAAPPAAPAE